MKSRIHLAALTIILVEFVSHAAASDDQIKLHEKLERLDFRSPGRALLLRDGRFIAVSKGRFLVRTETEDGWIPHGEIPAGPGPKVDGGLLIEDNAGRLVLIYRDDAGIKLERTPDNEPLPGARLQMWAVRSTDGGKSWSNHNRLIDGFCGAVIDGISTREGRLVIPLQELRYNPPRHVTVVFSSDNGGETWHRSRDLDIGGNGIEDGAFEATLAQQQDGSLLMLLRTTRERIWRSRSLDGGLTWTPPQPTEIVASNSPSFLLALESGRLALVWNPLQPTDGRDWPRRIKPRYAEKPDSVYREEMLFALSSDAGVTWTEPAIIAQQPGGKLRYAYMIERRPGEIWLALRGIWYRIQETDFVRR